MACQLNIDNLSLILKILLNNTLLYESILEHFLNNLSIYLGLMVDNPSLNILINE